MNTNEMNFDERIKIAKRKLKIWQYSLVLDLASDYENNVKVDIVHIKQYAKFIKNACIMHGIGCYNILLG